MPARAALRRNISPGFLEHKPTRLSEIPAIALDWPRRIWQLRLPEKYSESSMRSSRLVAATWSVALAVTLSWVLSAFYLNRWADVDSARANDFVAGSVPIELGAIKQAAALADRQLDLV